MDNYRAEFGTFRWMLEERTVDQLKVLVKTLGINTGKRKDDTIDNILNLTEDSRLKQLWQQMDDIQQKAVSETLYSDSKTYSHKKFTAKYSTTPVWGRLDGYYPSYEKKEEPSLLNFFMPWNHTIPSDLVPKLMEFVPKPEETRIKTKSQLPEFINNNDENIPLKVVETERALLYELPSVLRLVEHGKISVTDKKLLPTSSAVKNINNVLYGNDFFDDSDLHDVQANANYSKYYIEEMKTGPIKAVAWPSLLQSAKFSKKVGSKLILTKTGKESLGATNPATVVKMLFNGWKNSCLFDEFNRVDNIKGQTGKGKRKMTSPSNRKIYISDALNDCPSAIWISLDEFSKYMRAADYSFEVTLDPWQLYICEPRYGSLGYTGYDDWNILQDRYIKCVFMEYLATLGIIDIAYVHPVNADRDFSGNWGTDELYYLSRYDGLLYFRITNLGAYCLELTNEYKAPVFEETEKFKVLSNLEIAITQKELPPADELFLENFAEKKSDALWKITKKKLLEAYEKGHSVCEFIEFLRTNSSCELPKTALLFLDEIQERTESLKDKGMARLIECASEETTVFIANSTQTKKYCIQAGNKHIVVYAKDERKFQNALRQIGYAFKAKH